MKSCEKVALDSVKVKLTRMLYACGEGADLFRIDSVLYSQNENEDFYFNKEIIIDFDGRPENKQKPGSSLDQIYVGKIYRMETGMLKLNINKQDIVNSY